MTIDIAANRSSIRERAGLVPPTFADAAEAVGRTEPVHRSVGLVVDARPRRWRSTLALDGVARAMVADPPCDLFVVHPSVSEHRIAEGVVVGIDRSAGAWQVIRRAADRAAALDTWLHIVMSVDRARVVDVRVGTDRFRADSLTAAEVHLADVQRRTGHDRTSWSVASGRPGRAVCDAAVARGAATIVVGSRRVGGVGRSRGSVAIDVVRHAPCDVLVVGATGR